MYTSHSSRNEWESALGLHSLLHGHGGLAHHHALGMHTLGAALVAAHGLAHHHHSAHHLGLHLALHLMAATAHGHRDGAASHGALEATRLLSVHHALVGHHAAVTLGAGHSVATHVAVRARAACHHVGATHHVHAATHRGLHHAVTRGALTTRHLLSIDHALGVGELAVALVAHHGSAHGEFAAVAAVYHHFRIG